MLISILDDDIVLYRLHGMQPDQIYQQARLHAPRPFHLQSPNANISIKDIAPVPIGIITEICGPASTGKTQACLSFAVDYFMSMSNRKIIYIDTENNFSVDRLGQILSARYLQYSMSEDQFLQLANSLLVFKDSSPERLIERLRSLDELIISENIGCIILDSIAATCHSLTDSKRNEYLSECASQLKYLADKFQLSCLVSNQVIGNYQKSKANVASSTLVRPALGLQWTHAVNIRYMLKYSHQGSHILHVEKSPLGLFTVQYQITEAGLVPDVINQ